MKYTVILPLMMAAAVGGAYAQKTKADATKNETKRPNLLIVMADQWRGRAMGFLGVEPVKTPNIDKLAASGVVLNQAVSGYPVSSPARAMLMSGAYPAVNGVTGNCNSNTAPQNVELREDLTCWSDVLKAEGYATGYLGKWHLDKPLEPFVDCANNKGDMAWNEWCPPSRRHGFDYWTAYGTYDRHLRPLYWDTHATRDKFYYVDKWGPEYEADLAIEFIRSRAANPAPFALMVSMNPPHTGYDLVPDRYKEIYKDLDVDSVTRSWANASELEPRYAKYLNTSLADYYACMSGVDDQLGRIIAALTASGELENTIVVFTSDHGDLMGVHNHIGKNIFYEEAMRVPMIISHAGTLTPRLDNELLISLEDLYPTLLSMMGLGELTPPTVQTRDLSAQVLGSREKMPLSQLYMFWNEDVKGFAPSPADGARGVRTTRYTYSQRAADGRVVEECLFDRLNDPWQMANIAPENPKIVKQMRSELKKRLASANDPWLKAVKQ